MGRAKVLGGLLLLALLRHPFEALGATLPPTFSVTLAWNAGSGPVVNGYAIHYGTTSREYTNSIMVGNSLTNTLTGLTGGVTYFLAVTAYDANGLESPFSAEISYTVPTGLQTVGINVASNRQVMVTVTGQIGQTYNILATQDFKTWSAIGAVTMGSSGSVGFIDTNAASFSKRFYRTQE